MELHAQTPQAFVDWLVGQGLTCFYLVSTATQGLVPSHTALQPLADYLTRDCQDFDAHEGIFVHIGPVSGTLQCAVVHKTRRGPGAGGVRNWYYDTVSHFLSDGLRLSRGMSHKNALAGLWWGGGKGVIARNSGSSAVNPMDPDTRQTIYKEHGQFMTALKGCYITAEDAGTSLTDMASIFSTTRFTTCIPVELGGSGMPSLPTSQGVLRGIEAAFDFLGKSLVGSSIAVQGVGNVGTPLIHALFGKGVKRTVASDVDPAGRADSIRKEFLGHDFTLRVVGKDDMSILFEDVDAVTPNAVGGILNSETIPHIRAKIVCGAANNQLRDLKKDDIALKSRGILYLPDFLVNRMGIVNCADEHIGTLPDDPKLDLHLGKDHSNSIYCLSMHVLKEAQESGRTTQQIALEMAEQRSFEIHPLYGHRGKQVIDALVKEDKWKGVN